MKRKSKLYPGDLPITRIDSATGKRTYYGNLAVFNSVCSTRGYSGGLCTLTNLRCTKGLRGEGGLAVVEVTKFLPGSRTRHAPSKWLLGFADCSVLKSHLRRRVDDPKGFLR